ncbi:hypothetical protein D3C72_2054210 [compost metagenome]
MVGAQFVGDLDPAGDPGLVAGAMFRVADIAGIDQQCLQPDIGNPQLIAQFTQIDRIAAAQVERDDLKPMIAVIGQHRGQAQQRFLTLTIGLLHRPDL